jgi:predicted transporter
MLGCVGAFAIGVFSIGGRKTTRRIYSTWDCGFEGLDERMQYTASALSQPIRVIFRTLYKPYSDSEVSYFSESNHYLKKNARVEVYTRDLFDDLFYRPVTRATIAVLDAVRKMQTGKINAYLMYIMIALIALLVYAGVSR